MIAARALDFRSEAKFDEHGRQLSLGRLDMVGAKVEAPFEKIVDLVKTTLNAPIFAVSLRPAAFGSFDALAIDNSGDQRGSALDGFTTNQQQGML